MSDVTQLDVKCWVLKGQPDGRHWTSCEHALECAEPEDITQLPEPCWVGECGGCEEPMGDDDRYSQVHFDRRDDLAVYARDFEWHLDGEVLRHAECAPDQEDSR